MTVVVLATLVLSPLVVVVLVLVLVAATVVASVVDIPPSLGVLSVPSVGSTEKAVIISKTSSIATKEAVLLHVLVGSGNGESEGDDGKERKGLHGDSKKS